MRLFYMAHETKSGVERHPFLATQPPETEEQIRAAASYLIEGFQESNLDKNKEWIWLEWDNPKVPCLTPEGTYTSYDAVLSIKYTSGYAGLTNHPKYPICSLCGSLLQQGKCRACNQDNNKELPI